MEARYQEGNNANCQINRKDSKKGSWSLCQQISGPSDSYKKKDRSKIRKELDVRMSPNKAALLGKVHGQMKEGGRGENIDEHVNGIQPGWPHGAYFKKKSEKQPQHCAKNKKDPTDSPMRFHQKDKGAD